MSKEREEADEEEEELNDPGNEDPGSLMDDAEVPLSDVDEAENRGGTVSPKTDPAPWHVVHTTPAEAMNDEA